MRRRFAPATVFATNVIVSFAAAAAIVLIALSQPWVGVYLSKAAAGPTLTYLSSQSDIPAARIGQRVIGIAADDAERIAIDLVDLIEEPDTIDGEAALTAFYQKQDQLHAALSDGPVTFVFDGTAPDNSATITARESRPIGSLPVKFWAQIFVGLVGMMVGGWVFSARLRDSAGWMVYIAGIGLAMSSGAAALYSSREIALSAEVFTTASRVNSVGTLLFGIGMVTLFLIYPRAIVPRYIVALPTFLLGAVISFIQFVDWPRHVGLLQDAVAVTMLVLLVAIAAQVAVNRRDPLARAMLGWLGLCVVIGAGGFVLTAIVPTLLGQELWLEQSTAFLLFLIIYIGIALGVVRYRLFDLAAWSYGVLFYGGGVALLLLLDAGLVFGLSVDRTPAFAIALAAIGALYLPLRERFGAWVRRKKKIPEDTLFRRVTEISHVLDPMQKITLLTQFWSDMFNPLSVDVLAGEFTGDSRLTDDGSAMVMAPVFGLPAVQINWAEKGAKLFSNRELQRAKDANYLIDSSLRQSHAYRESVTSERSRINRDMHDNIGVLLLSALHTTSVDRKDLLLRQTLTDLREIISNPDLSHRKLRRLVADLRAEIMDHLDASDVRAHWQDVEMPDVTVAPQIVHTLRALLREGVSNILRHSGATEVGIVINVADDVLRVVITDNGQGFALSDVQEGNGVKNLSARVAQSGGDFDIATDESGTKLTARIPLVSWMADAGT